MKAMGFIEEQVPGQTRRQFVTAAIVSCREIETIPPISRKTKITLTY
jgi:hypothetical protein